MAEFRDRGRIDLNYAKRSSSRMSQHKLQGRGVIDTTCQIPDAFIAMLNNQVVAIDKLVMYDQWVPDTNMKVPKA